MPRVLGNYHIVQVLHIRIGLLNENERLSVLEFKLILVFASGRKRKTKKMIVGQSMNVGSNTMRLEVALLVAMGRIGLDQIAQALSLGRAGSILPFLRLTVNCFP